MQVPAGKKPTSSPLQRTGIMPLIIYPLTRSQILAGITERLQVVSARTRVNSGAFPGAPVLPVTISSGISKATIDLTGAHVTGLVLGGERVIKPSRDGSPTHGGIAVLIPYAGRVKQGRYRFEGKTFHLPVRGDGLAIHGFAKDARWGVLGAGSGSVVLGCRLAGRGYPSTIDVTVSYSVRSAVFKTGCRVRNVGGRDSPLVVGFHPYLLGRGRRNSTGARAYRYRLRDRYFPTGEKEPFSFGGVGPHTSLDDCFEVHGDVLFRSGDLQVVMGRNRMPYLVVYDGEYSEGRSVAIEPYTGLPDAYNNGIGLRVLKPGGVFSCGYWLGLKEAGSSR